MYDNSFPARFAIGPASILVLCKPTINLNAHRRLLDSPVEYPPPYSRTVILQLHPAEHLADDRRIPDVELEPSLYVVDPQLRRLGILLGMALKSQDRPRIVEEALVVLREGDESRRSDSDFPSVVLLEPKGFRPSLGRGREEPLSVRRELDFCHPEL